MIYVADEPRVALAATLENGWTVINTHLSFVPFVNYRQLRKDQEVGGRTFATLRNSNFDYWRYEIFQRDYLPLRSTWNSLVQQNSYPSWGAKIQFDYILSDSLKPDQYESLPTVVTGVSDHLPVRVKIL